MEADRLAEEGCLPQEQTCCSNKKLQVANGSVCCVVLGDPGGAVTKRGWTKKLDGFPHGRSGCGEDQAADGPARVGWCRSGSRAVEHARRACGFVLGSVMQSSALSTGAGAGCCHAQPSPCCPPAASLSKHAGLNAGGAVPAPEQRPLM